MRHGLLCLLATALLLLEVVCPAVWGDAFNDPLPAVAEKPVDVKTEHKRNAVFSKPAPQNVADLLAIENQVKKLVKHLTRCTVGVRIGRAQGSGVIVSKDGYVLTAAHVAGAPGRKVTFLLADGRLVQGKSLGVDRTVDAALLKMTDKGNWPYAEMGDVTDMKVGDWCIATGHPGGYQKGRAPVVRLGRVSFVRNTLIQTDCTLVGGDSGGPLFDVDGRVIGIHSRIGAPTSWNFHVPISAYTDHWDRLTLADTVLGVGGKDVENGCKLTEIESGLPAEKAGLQVGDVIVKFNGQPVKDFDELATAVRKKKPGDKVTLEILRGEKTIQKTAVLAKRQ